jgi:hypothetical protein
MAPNERENKLIEENINYLKINLFFENNYRIYYHDKK